jgi:hypothetical protein
VIRCSTITPLAHSMPGAGVVHHINRYRSDPAASPAMSAVRPTPIDRNLKAGREGRVEREEEDGTADRLGGAGQIAAAIDVIDNQHAVERHRRAAAGNFVDVNWATGYDANGRPMEVAESRSPDQPFDAIPGPFGAHNWHPMSYNPQTGLVYLPA